MSRAVLRKRKRLTKHQQSSLHQSDLTGFSAGDDDDEGEEDGLESDDELDVDRFAGPSVEPAEVEAEDDKVAALDVTSMTLKDIACIRDDDDMLSAHRADLLLKKIISPTLPSAFFAKHWERLPLHCGRSSAGHFRKTFSKSLFEKLVDKHLMFARENIDFWDPKRSVTRVAQEEGEGVQGVDEVLVADSDEPEREEVSSAQVWARFTSGCAVRLLSPQQYHDPTWQLLASLEHAFGCRVGAEVVLAPAGFSSAAAYSGPSKDAEGEKDRKEGVAMYDNADAFLLQLEGRSRWRVGKSPHGETVLPAEAGYVALKDMGGWEGAETLDVVLEPGDSLYVPKGWVHQQDNYGEGGDAHSLHLRVYANQGLGSTTAGLLELVVPQALADAIQTEAQLRGALPRRWGSLLGVAVSEAEAGEMPQRSLLLSRVGKLLQAVAQRALEILDPAADQLAKQFVSERLPVPLSAEEEGRSAAGAPDAVIYPYTQLRMVRPGVAVMVVESGKVVLYHCMDNSRELFGSALSPMEFELDDGPAVEALLRAYPTGVVVSELDHPSEEMDDKLGVALALYKEGFLLIDDEASNPSGVPIRRMADLPTGTKSGAKKKRVKKGTGAIGIPVVDDDDIF